MVDASDELRTIVARRHPEFRSREGLTDWFNSGTGRFISPVTLCAEIIETGFFDAAPLDALLKRILSEEYVFEAFGVMMALEGCPQQRKHRDGGALFDETGIDAILPPSTVTLVAPLVDVNADNAPTAIYPGTHHYDQRPEQPPDIPEYPRGSLALWDFRVLHHGCENRTPEPRPVLYMTACRPFWIGHRNFGKGNRKLIAEPQVIEALDRRFVRAERV